MAYRTRRRRTTRYSAPRRRTRRTATRRRRTGGGKKTIVIQLVQGPMGGAMSTGTLGKKQATPLLRARF